MWKPASPALARPSAVGHSTCFAQGVYSCAVSPFVVCSFTRRCSLATPPPPCRVPTRPCAGHATETVRALKKRARGAYDKTHISTSRGTNAPRSRIFSEFPPPRDSRLSKQWKQHSAIQAVLRSNRQCVLERHERGLLLLRRDEPTGRKRRDSTTRHAARHRGAAAAREAHIAPPARPRWVCHNVAMHNQILRAVSCCAHIAQVERWKLNHCEWQEAYKHPPPSEEEEDAGQSRMSTEHPPPSEEEEDAGQSRMSTEL